MCGRYTIRSNVDALLEAFNEFLWPEDLHPRFNIAPTQHVPVATNTGEQSVEFYRWGLIPSWAKDPAIGNRMINARAETLADKASFRVPFRRRRCLVFADGFYEWRQEGKGKPKTPMYITLKSGEPFAFAGLWDTWRDPESNGPVRSFTIITTTPNDLLKSIHNRMPVMLPRNTYDQWLDPAEWSPDRLSRLLQPYPAGKMTAYAVSRAVNNPKADTPACIEPETVPL